MKEKSDRTQLESNSFARTIINSLSAHIAILSEDGVIVETNRAWKEYANANANSEHPDSVGLNYLDLCDTAAINADEIAQKVARGIRSVISGEVTEFLLDYPCHSPHEKRWFYLRAVRMHDAKPLRIVVSHENITALKLAEEALREREHELEQQRQNLVESNIALKVLLERREADKDELDKKFLSNMKDLILPYVEKLKSAPLKARERRYVEIIDTHLQDIISPLLQRLANIDIILTPQEIQVASLVKDGKTSKEIAEVLHVSLATVHFHRKNLREKFGLKNSQTNLRTYLLKMAE
jgi:DNA-binding CsgD family transcriptional regulator